VDEHAIELRFDRPAGKDSRVHDTPPFVVAMTLGLPENPALTAWHIANPKQLTLSSVPTPVGIASSVHVDPPSEVPITTGSPKIPNPTALQFDVLTHVIPLRPSTLDGMLSTVHVFPSLTVAAIESVPEE
jgi:hypothetical protein